MTYKQKVLQKYRIEAKYEVTAIEWKKMFGKALSALLATGLLSGVAFGHDFHKGQFDKYEKGMNKIVQQIQDDTGSAGHYSFKIDFKETDKAQRVDFKVLKDGKTVGITTYSHADGATGYGSTVKDGCSDQNITWVVDLLTDMVKDNIK